MAGKVITDFIRMQLFKKGGAIANDKAVKFSADALEKRLINLGVDPNSINNQTQLKQLLAYVKQAEDQQFNQLYSGILSGDEAAKFLNKAFPKKGEVIPFPQKRSFKEEIEAMKKSGDIVDEKDMVISEKITDREMFKDASKRFNKTDMVADTVTKIISMEPVAAMKEANKIIGRKGIYKNLTEEQSQKILKDTDDWIFQRDPSDLYDYKKNRPFRDDPDYDPDEPGFYTGGLVDVEPNLSDIGHGADALMARTRLVAPNSQATTSTGLNYLLAEDNDNLRVPFRFGGMGPGEVLQDEKKMRQMMENFLIRRAPFGILTPPPKNLNIKNLNTADRPPEPEFEIGPYDPQSDIDPFSKDNVVEFDDGTFMYKDTGKYYKLGEEDEPYEVPGPSKGAKIKPIVMEAAEGGRIGFQAGGMGRRAFLKLLAALTGGAAAAKSGILSLGGKEAGKKAVTETIKKSAGSGQPPPYFYKLVEKIRFMGDDTLASKDKAIAKKYKDYYMEEDFQGNIEIIKKGEDLAGNKLEDVYMKYTVDDVALKNKKGFAKVDEYEEFTARPDMEGKMKDVEQGVPDEVIEEAGDTTAMTLKKADGGRIGFSGGNLARFLAGLKITGSSGRFLEKVFGKEGLKEMTKRDPEMYRGLLEVVEMFRNRDTKGLKIYMQKFLPHMDDETVEAFIKGDAADAAGQAKYGLDNMQGQLIRLGSGRDYAGKLEMMKKLDNAKKLDALDVTEEMIRKPNSSGGIQTMLGE